MVSNDNKITKVKRSNENRTLHGLGDVTLARPRDPGGSRDSVGEHVFAEAVDADELFVDVGAGAGERVNGQQLVARR